MPLKLSELKQRNKNRGAGRWESYWQGLGCGIEHMGTLSGCAQQHWAWKTKYNSIG